MSRLTGLAGLGLVAIALIAGCGDDGSSGDDRLSRSEFIRMANDICRRGSHDIEVASEALPTRRLSSRRAIEFAEEWVIPTTQAQIDQIRELSPPKEDEARVKAFLNTAQSSVDKVKAEPKLLIGGRPDPFAEAKRLARDHGLSECAG